MGWCHSNRLKHHFEKRKCYSEYLHLFRWASQDWGRESDMFCLFQHGARWCCWASQTNVIIYQTVWLAVISAHYDMPGCSTALHWSQPVKIIFKTRRATPGRGRGHTYSASLKFCHANETIVAGRERWKGIFSSTLSLTLLITTNFEQMLPYHRHITISVLDSLEKHYWAAHSFCSMFIVESLQDIRRRFVAISIC